jgi:hypothetical protein
MSATLLLLTAIFGPVLVVCFGPRFLLWLTRASDRGQS